MFHGSQCMIKLISEKNWTYQLKYTAVLIIKLCPSSAHSADSGIWSLGTSFIFSRSLNHGLSDLGVSFPKTTRKGILLTPLSGWSRMMSWNRWNVASSYLACWLYSFSNVIQFAPACGEQYSVKLTSPGKCFATTVILLPGTRLSSSLAVVKPATPPPRTTKLLLLTTILTDFQNLIDMEFNLSRRQNGFLKAASLTIRPIEDHSMHYKVRSWVTYRGADNWLVNLMTRWVKIRHHLGSPTVDTGQNCLRMLGDLYQGIMAVLLVMIFQRLWCEAFCDIRRWPLFAVNFPD